MSRRNKFFALLLALPLPLPLCAADYVTAYEAKYSNPDYGFVARFPRKMRTCTTHAPGPNHGFVLMLRASSCEESARMREPHIELFVSYDTAIMATTTAELSGDTCPEGKSWPTQITSAGVPVYGCDATATDGLVRRRYFFLHPRRDEVGVVFIVDLYTTKFNAAADLALTKGLLRGIQWCGSRCGAVGERGVRDHPAAPPAKDSK